MMLEKGVDAAGKEKVQEEIGKVKAILERTAGRIHNIGYRNR